MPVDNWLVILPWATRYPFISISRNLLGHGFDSLLLLLLCLDREVDVCNLKVHLRNELHLCNVRDDLQNLRATPNIVDERSISVQS